MPYFCPNCQSPITDSKIPDSVTELKCSDCKSRWIRTELQEDETLEAGTKLGGFEVIRPIGVGGMGQVYLALQLSLDREVALKILPKELARDQKAMKRFLQEVRHTAALEHRAIITVFEAGTENNIGFLAMDFVDGASLDRMLKRTKEPIEQDEALRVTRDVAGALRHAWSRQQLLHRDIKPANIMIDKNGRVRLLDLGIAKRPAEKRSADKSTLTQRGMAIGTPHYMSPEQARGEPDLDSRSDQYALGTTLFHLLTATRPFEGTSVVDILAKQINREPEPLRKLNSDISPGCIRIVERMMAKKKGDRYPTWDEVIIDLDLVRAGGSPAPLEVAPPQEAPAAAILSPIAAVVPGKRGSARRIALLIGLLLVVVALTMLNIILPIRGNANDEIAQGSTTRTVKPGNTPKTPEPSLEPTPRPEPEPEPIPVPIPDAVAGVLTAGRQNKSPIPVAEQFANSEDPDAYKTALTTIIEKVPGDDGEWARAATTLLAAHYKKTGDRDQLEQLLLSRLAPTHQDDHATPDDFIRAANWYFATNKPKDAIRLLWGAIRQGKDGDPEITAAAATRLAEVHRKSGDRQQLRLILHHTLDTLPETHPVHGRFTAEMAELFGTGGNDTPEEPDTPEDPILAGLARLIKDTKIPIERRKLQLRYAKALQAAERYGEAVVQFRELIADTPDAAEKAELSLELAACHQRADEIAPYLEILTKIAELPPTTALAPHGTMACRLLAKYYQDQKNPFLRNRYLLDIADRYGKVAPVSAAEALFQVATWHEQKGRERSAVDMLKRISKDLSAAGKDTQTRANTEMARIYKEHPELSKRAEEKEDAANTTPDAIVLGGRTKYLRMGRSVSAISSAKSVTVSFWIYRVKQTQGTRALVSRFNPDNNRGFHIASEYDNTISFTIGNGDRTAFARTGKRLPENEWMHVTAIAANNKMWIYLDGKLAGQGVYPNDLNLDGAGRLHVGQKSWTTGGNPHAWFRYITVYPSKIYDKDFTPTETPPDFAKSAVCLTVRKDKVGDLRRNPVDVK